MKYTNITKLVLLTPVLLFQLFFVSALASLNSQTVYAITCPDGSTLPDSQADQCPPADDTNDTGDTGATNNGAISTAQRCAQAQPGTPEADGCTFYAPEFAEQVNKEGKHQCGKGPKAIKVGFNFGCRGEEAPGDMNPIVDIMLAIFRFLSTGVGIVVIGSVVVAGIQYTMSRGDPQTTAAAINRVTSAVGALILYLFIFAIANFIIPGGMFL